MTGYNAFLTIDAEATNIKSAVYYYENEIKECNAVMFRTF